MFFQRFLGLSLNVLPFGFQSFIISVFSLYIASLISILINHLALCIVSNPWYTSFLFHLYHIHHLSPSVSKIGPHIFLNILFLNVINLCSILFVSGHIRNYNSRFVSPLSSKVLFFMTLRINLILNILTRQNMFLTVCFPTIHFNVQVTSLD